MRNRDINHGGVWPAVKAGEDERAEPSAAVHVDFVSGKRLSPHDLSEGIPEHVDSIAPETLAAIIFATGLVVAFGGVAILDAACWAKVGLAACVGAAVGWAAKRK